MPLTLKGKSKARLEILWDGHVPVNIEIISASDNSIIFYKETLNTNKINLELSQLDFLSIDYANEVQIVVVAKVGENVYTSETLLIQKCPHLSCGQWGHAREDGYCKHCGRRVRDQNYSSGFYKVEIGDFKIILWNGTEGTLWKKKESKEYAEKICSIGYYEDKNHPKESVEIVEEKFDEEAQKNFVKLHDLLKAAELLDKHWKPPLSCFQEEHQRTVWIYYPRYSKQNNWREISALSYILTNEIELLSTRDIIKIGIQLCEIVKKIHQQKYVWGSLKLEDVIICRDKDKNVSVYLSSKDIAWEEPLSKKLIDIYLTPWELFWESSNESNVFCEITEVYIIAALLYFLKAKSPNLLSYNPISYHHGLPSLKLFVQTSQEKKLQRDPIIDYFESTINQALFLDPQERGYQNVNEFQLALQHLLESPKSIQLKRSYILDIGEALDVGNEKRDDDLSQNQDAVFVTTFTLKKHKWGMFVLCDGISTATIGSGDIASRVVVNTFKDWWAVSSEKERKEICKYASSSFENSCKFLNEMLNIANKNISIQVEKLATHEQLENSLIMGTTITTGIIYEGSMVFGWLGDSPIYRISPFGWERLNYEDNERNLRIKKGLPLDECFIDGGNALTRCVGAHFYSNQNLEMHFGHTYLYPEENILICSDGIPDYIEQDASYAHHENYQMLRIASVISNYEKDCLLDAKSLASIIISTVNKIGGGYDNLSAILINVQPEPTTTFEVSYQKLRSISPILQKLLKNLESGNI